ncbi:MAG: type II toxin-antitoxin system RelE/ParE family toxin [Rickettsiales bacterium]
MQTVIETYEFIKQAKGLLTRDEIEELISYLAESPDAGDVIQGTGGFRKLRFKRSGTGKSGGVRVIYFFFNEGMPVSLISVYAKSKSDNITDKQRNALYAIAQEIKKGG